MSVVLYHANPSLLPGGFTGVNIFFVISGYLITSILRKEIEGRRFSLTQFYLRRARRILPALTVVLFATAIAGALFLLPTDFRLFGRHMLYTGLFLSNFVFWKETGYFDEAAELKPLLHTWSLGVEEQFYLAWPLLLILGFRKRTVLWPLLGILGLASFAVACWAVVYQPAAAFYLLPMRAWELWIGAALALGFFPRTQHRWMKHLCSLVGMGLIVVGVLALDEHTPFPGWNALLPCTGAALLIGVGEQGLCNRYLLRVRPVVWVGLISYSLYLWHWPILSLSRLILPYRPDSSVLLALLFLAVFLSALTYRYVETPFRAGGFRDRVDLRHAAFATLVTAAVGGGILLGKGIPGRFSPDVLAAAQSGADVNPWRATCLQDPENDFAGLDGRRCQTPGDGRGYVLVWGDSHADTWVPGITALAREEGRGLIEYAMNACPPLVDVDFVDAETRIVTRQGCTAFNRAVLQEVLNRQEIEIVFLAARWALYVERTRFGAEDRGPRPPFLVDARHRRLTTEDSRVVLREALQASVRTLTAAGKRVVVVGQIPEFGFDVPRCYAKERILSAWGFTVSGASAENAPPCSVPSGVVRDRLGLTNSMISQVVAKTEGTCGLFAEGAICAEGYCRGQQSKATLYVDDDHLSRSGGMRLLGNTKIRSQLTPCLLLGSDRRKKHFGSDSVRKG
jgi:peptidoglycan/LPS O-acetylase OafA/YrhL